MTALEVIDEAVKMGLWSADVNRGQKRANLASLVSRELKVNGTRWMRVGRGQFALGTQVEAKVEGTLL